MKASTVQDVDAVLKKARSLAKKARAAEAEFNYRKFDLLVQSTEHAMNKKRAAELKFTAAFRKLIDLLICLKA